MRLVTCCGSTSVCACLQLKSAASSRFGSGWSWLVVKPDKGLEVTSTANQDNPLMNVSLTA